MNTRNYSGVLIMLILVFSAITASAYPDLHLPYIGGTKLKCDQGNNSNPFIVGNTHYNRLAYSWDFNILGTTGNGDMGWPQVAPADGKIVFAGDGDDGWGYCVIIEYDDGTEGLLGHLQTIFVKKGEIVQQSQVIGLTGNGYVPNENYDVYSAHCHYQTQQGQAVNSESIASSFIDVISNNGIPQTFKGDYKLPKSDTLYYRSSNTFLFDQKYQALGGPAFFGDMITDYTDPSNPTGIHWYSPFSSSDKRNAYIIDYTGNANRCGASMPAALVYDALNGARNVYSLICGFAKWWFDNGGPKSVLGMPIGDEY